MNRQIINRRYRVEQQIGEGATAEVYLGFDIVLNRRVAIKTLRPSNASNRAFRLRFEREAQAAARFTHPNIISIFDVGDDHGLLYIVMEYIDGQTLRDIIREEGPFHPDDVAVLIEQVSAGLDYAHRHGLVHRDIKPENILVDRHGLAKVVDFGIARGLSDATLTETGSAMGTVQYISPEQASGLMATPESDIYSLGVIAFEMLTGALPFEAESPVAIAMRHLNDPAPDPTSYNPDVPPEVADIVLQALEKNPTRRFPTAGAFARALTDWRLFEPAPRLAARYLPPRETATYRGQRADPAETVPGFQLGEVERHSGEFRDPIEQAPFFDNEPSGRGKSWLAGLVAMAAIVALIWYVFGVSDRINGASDDPTPTQEIAAATRTSASNPTATAQVTATASTAEGLVPNVVGRSRADAEALLADAGLTMELGDGISSMTVPSGAVALQNPAVGTQSDEGDTVTVNLSTGVPKVDLAKMKAAGRPQDAVVSELTSAGLNVELVEEGSATVAEGAVIRLEPADTAVPGDVVSVYISRGDRVQIPFDLQGQPVAVAKSRLEELGLTVTAEIGVSASVITNAGLDLNANQIVDGDVVGVQDNGAQFGGWLDRGSAVTLVYYDADAT